MEFFKKYDKSVLAQMSEQNIETLKKAGLDPAKVTSEADRKRALNLAWKRGALERREEKRKKKEEAYERLVSTPGIIGGIASDPSHGEVAIVGFVPDRKLVIVRTTQLKSFPNRSYHVLPTRLSNVRPKNPEADF